MLNQRFMMRSLDDKDRSPDIEMLFKFLSAGNNQNTCVSASEDEDSGNTDHSQIMMRVLQQIRMVDINEPDDKNFREAILRMIRRFSNNVN